MNTRFKKEKNIPQWQKNDTKYSHKNTDSAGWLHISKTYASVRTRSIFTSTLLLIAVIILLFFFAGWLIPRVFSFRLSESPFLRWFVSSTLVEKDPEKEVRKNLDILLLWRWWLENDAPDLTDSIIYGHINAGEPLSISALSIPRDLLIHSKILGRVKINEVYSGVKNSIGEKEAFVHLLETVSTITGRKIEHYAMIDFAGFRKLIDIVWGIDIDVPERLYDNEYPTKNWWYTVVDIPVGLQHFDWDKALKYARSRHTTSDFDRSKRQQLVITAIREKLLSLDVLSSPKKIQDIYETLRSSVKTNLTLPQMFQMAQYLAQTPKENISWYALDNTCFDVIKMCHPGGLLYVPERSLFHGASVLLPKKATATNVGVYDPIQLLVNVMITYPNLWSEASMTIVNASGKTNLALSVALKLRSIGIPVSDTQIRNQKERVEKTFIRYNSLIIKPDNILLKSFTSLFALEIREATPDEKIDMLGAYELVLGPDASTYFK
jgi:LCP family protein required for cell wall assembly